MTKPLPFAPRYVPFLLFALLLSLGDSAAAAKVSFHTVYSIPLPGNPTRLDYQSLDTKTRRLFIAHLGDSSVIVYDTQQRKVVDELPGIAKVHGVLAVPSLGRVFASATGTNEVVAIDSQTLHITGRAPAGVYPDGIAFDPDNNRLFVSDEHGDTVTVLSAHTLTRVATIPLGGQVGNTQYDPVSQHVFSAEQTHNQLIETDPVRATVLKKYDLPGCQGSHGLYIDQVARLAFIACEDNARLVTFDMKSMKEIQLTKIDQDPDVLAYDHVDKAVFVGCESGTVSILEEHGRTLRKLADIFVANAAHTISVDPQTHLIYVPLENVNGKPFLRVMRLEK